MNIVHAVGIVPCLSGAVYLRRPNIFHRAIRLRTSVMMRTLTPEEYEQSMGRALLVLGLCFFLAAFLPNVHWNLFWRQGG